MKRREAMAHSAAFVDGECFSPINREGVEVDPFKFESSTIEKRAAGNIVEGSSGPLAPSTSTVNRNSEKIKSSQEE